MMNEDKEITILPLDIRNNTNKYEFAQIVFTQPKKEETMANKTLAALIANASVKNNVKNNVKKNIKKEESKSCCPFYNRDSEDSRCCGLCYCCCPTKSVEEQCNCCPNSFEMYWHSGYVQTTAGYGKEEENGICCWCCFPIKFPVFFPCFIGSLVNSSINRVRKTNNNYLF
jgi:hypothetical protein